MRNVHRNVRELFRLEQLNSTRFQQVTPCKCNGTITQTPAGREHQDAVTLHVSTTIKCLLDLLIYRRRCNELIITASEFHLKSSQSSASSVHQSQLQDSGPDTIHAHAHSQALHDRLHYSHEIVDLCTILTINCCHGAIQKNVKGVRYRVWQVRRRQLRNMWCHACDIFL